MTRGEIRTWINRSLNDPNAVFLPTADGNTVIEEAQELLSEHGPPVIRRIGLTMRAYWTFYRLSTFAPDAIMPVRIYCVPTSFPLEPVSQDDLDALNVSWESTTGNPHLWFSRGFDNFGIYPRPATTGGILWVDYMAWAQSLLHDAAEPEFAVEDHEALAVYGLYDGLIRGAQVEEATRLWQGWVGLATKGRAIRADTTPDMIEQKGRGEDENE